MKSLETYLAALENELLNACLDESMYRDYIAACKRNAEVEAIRDKGERAKNFGDDPEYLKLYNAYKELKKWTSQTSDAS